jgi:hypothetical protein
MSVLIVDVADHVAVVTLNRPSPRNALNPKVLVELDRCRPELRDDSGVRAVGGPLSCFLCADPILSRNGASGKVGAGHIRMAVYSGLRRGEILGLPWSDIATGEDSGP